MEKYKNKDHVKKLIRAINGRVKLDARKHAVRFESRTSLEDAHKAFEELDNQVHIAHNCYIGKNTIIGAKTAIAGSTKIGDDCLIGGGCVIVDNLQIEKNVKHDIIAFLTSITERVGKEAK